MKKYITIMDNDFTLRIRTDHISAIHKDIKEKVVSIYVIGVDEPFEVKMDQISKKMLDSVWED